MTKGRTLQMRKGAKNIPSWCSFELTQGGKLIFHGDQPAMWSGIDR